MHQFSNDQSLLINSINQLIYSHLIFSSLHLNTSFSLHSTYFTPLFLIPEGLPVGTGTRQPQTKSYYKPQKANPSSFYFKIFVPLSSIYFEDPPMSEYSIRVNQKKVFGDQTVYLPSQKSKQAKKKVCGQESLLEFTAGIFCPLYKIREVQHSDFKYVTFKKFKIQQLQVQIVEDLIFLLNKIIMDFSDDQQNNSLQLDKDVLQTSFLLILKHLNLYNQIFIMEVECIFHCIQKK
ncbi:unnamed protein product [Paramecium octaurelia]|uniref:Uncharacterized protein n=1 Tax=Paramecium octaurelia TaxID=43137 RepID=A0A8S1SJH5_PAROT|nr:unnamed protein product [Paramecium octaurelia]